MKNKYYTPTSDEFHQGFEFEANYTKEGWQKEIFGIGEKSIDSIPQLCVSFLKGKPFEEHIRVKHLDLEDIESLGWKQDSIHENNYELICNRKEFKEEFSLFYDKEENEYVISNNQEYELYDQYFKGKIRNKSELAKIMKMLNIEVDGKS